MPTFPDSSPGQFVQVLCRAPERTAPAVLDWPADGFPSLSVDSLAEPHAFLRRPFSIADRWPAADNAVRLAIISRTVGPGTLWLERLRPGDTVDLTGPLGRGFRIPDPRVSTILVGGGVGIPPLLYLARRLHDLGRTEVVAILGATERGLFPVHWTDEPSRDGTPTTCVAWPGGAAFPAAVTSDDGSVGLRGVVSDALRVWHAGRRDDRPGTVLACGPEGMLKAVARMTRELGLACQLCIERPMGCGLGTCLSCVVRAVDVSRETGWRWKLACTDGPVFDRDDLLDYSGTDSA